MEALKIWQATCLKNGGAFPSEGRGFCVVEGTNVEVMKMTAQYVLYVSFETESAASIE